jgi:hypothetical protein
MFTLGHLDALETGFDLFLNPTGRSDLAKHDPKLTIAPEPPGRPHLNDRALQMASLRKHQVLRRE